MPVPRYSFDRAGFYVSVVRQQGRVQLDPDVAERVAGMDGRLRAVLGLERTPALLGQPPQDLSLRRLTLLIETTLSSSLQWAAFQPNGPALWRELALSAGAYLQTLFLEGALMGDTPQQAYFVRCDATTTTQADIALGHVNLIVGFAPVYPAEFLVLVIGLLTGK